MMSRIEKIIAYAILGLIVLFAFAFLSKQLVLTYHLREGIKQANNAAQNLGDLKGITQLHQASARIFLLTFLGFLIVISGFAIVFSGTQKAYDLAEVKEKVRTHLKSTTTGLLMIVAGLCLLAFCSYKHSNIEAFYSSKLVNNNNEKLAVVQPVNANEKPVHIDSTMLPQTNNSINKLAEKYAHKNLDTPLTIAKKAREQLVKLSQMYNNKLQPNNLTQKTNVVHHSNPLIKNYVSIPLANKSSFHSTANVSVNENDVSWAKQLERNTVLYGYLPHNIDDKKYENVMQQKGNELNGDMHWAYTFLEKTKQGYQPNEQELRRYEKIIEQKILLAKQNITNE